MQVTQTAVEPPNHGRIILAIMGWTWKSRNDPIKIMTA